MEIISVNIQKGGSGKTTTVQALAELLSKEYRKKVLCIDSDPQCNLSSVSGVDLMACLEHNLYNLLREVSTLDDCVIHATYYDIITGSLVLSYADPEFNFTGNEYF